MTGSLNADLEEIGRLAHSIVMTAPWTDDVDLDAALSAAERMETDALAIQDLVRDAQEVDR